MGGTLEGAAAAEAGERNPGGGSSTTEGGVGAGGERSDGGEGAVCEHCGAMGGTSEGVAGTATGGRNPDGGSSTSEDGERSDGGEGVACELCGGDECIDLDSDLQHCGVCNRACALDGVDEAECRDGVCTSSCQTGRGNCYRPEEPTEDNGCETDLDTNLGHCGACGRACLATGGVDEARCSAGRCVSTCRPGYLNLIRPDGSEADDGCEEVDVAVNRDHCGAEGRACASANVNERRCEDGICTSLCASGHANVTQPAAPTADDGCEVTFETNVDHCGAEGRACSSTNVSERRCEGGVCTSSCANGHGNVTQPIAPAADDGCEADCPGTTGGPELVRLPEGYCIDATEVTQEQYAEWLNRTPAPSTEGQDAWCDWNDSYTPTCDWDPEAMGDYPVVCVDWCDAVAYCRGVGKRLCGAIGGGPAVFTSAGSQDPDTATGQWLNACRSGLANNEYTYGNKYNYGWCNDWDRPLSVASIDTCQSRVIGYEGVYDLSGNVEEWEDACEGYVDDSDFCHLRGGSYEGGEELLHQCLAVSSATRRSRSFQTGFRCCAP